MAPIQKPNVLLINELTDVLYQATHKFMVSSGLKYSLVAGQISHRKYPTTRASGATCRNVRQARFVCKECIAGGVDPKFYQFRFFSEPGSDCSASCQRRRALLTSSAQHRSELDCRLARPVCGPRRDLHFSQRSCASRR